MGATRAGIVTAVAALAGACGLDLVGAMPAGDAGVIASGDASSSGGSSSGSSGAGSDASADAPADANEGGGSAGSSIGISSLQATGASIDVTTEGTLDWFVWGPDGVATPIRRSGANEFSAFAASGADVGAADLSFPLLATWSGGTPAPASGTSGIHAYAGNGTGAKLEFDVAADTTTRTLAIYLGAYAGACSLTATLSDGSGASANASFSGPAAGFTVGRYVVTFAASSATAKLHVAWTTSASATYCDVLAGTLK